MFFSVLRDTVGKDFTLKEVSEEKLYMHANLNVFIGFVWLEKGDFRVFKNALLREVKFQWTDEDGKIHVFDGFARHCQLLDHKLPAITRVPVCHHNAFLIEVRIELDLCVYLLIKSMHVLAISVDQ